MILQEMKGRRAIISFVGQRNMEVSIVRIDDVDEKYVKVTTIPPKNDKYEIRPGITSYLNLEAIDSITDAEDEKVFNMITANLKQAAENRLKQQMAAQKAREEAAQKAAQEGAVDKAAEEAAKAQTGV